jgi:hypothetical protein
MLMLALVMIIRRVAIKVSRISVASGRHSRSTKTQCEITMSKLYTRLTEDERYQIYEGVTEKRSHREIAIQIKKHHSTIFNEVKRNKGLRGCRPKQT